MNTRGRVFASLDGRCVDQLPLMPITMMFAADRIGVPYGKYALDYRVLVEAQLRTAEEFGFDLALLEYARSPKPLDSGR